MAPTAEAMGSKPNAKTSGLLFPAGVTLLVLTFLPFVYIIPYYINMILQVPAGPAARPTHTHTMHPTATTHMHVHMGHHAESPGVQEQAAGALSNLADRSDLRQRIKRAGAGEAVRRAMAAPGATAIIKTWGQKVLDALKKV